MDISDTILAKSDQLNAVDLPPQKIVAKITSVTKHRAEQPVSVHLEGYDGRPYKPCLSMRRVLAQSWGTDSSAWVGRSIELYCDNSVKWAGKEVGGIRISRLSDLPGPLQIPIATSKHVRELYEVFPLELAEANHEEEIESAVDMSQLKTAFLAAYKAATSDEERNKYTTLKDAKKAQIEEASK